MSKRKGARPRAPKSAQNCPRDETERVPAIAGDEKR